MSEKSIIDQIKHYQRDIDKCPQNSDRMIRCIQRLCVLPVTVQHLQDTGIGRSVNSLRKYGGEAADAAKALVAKWKAMVAAEESSDVEDSHDEPSPEKSRDTLSSPDQNKQSVLNSDHKTNPNQEMNSSLLNKSSSLSKKSNSVDISNSSHNKSSHQSVSEHKSSSKHRSHDSYNSISDDKSKHRDKRSNSDNKSNSEKHRNSSQNVSKSDKTLIQRSSKNNTRSDSKSHNKDKNDDTKYKANDHKSKKSPHSAVTEKEHRQSREQSKSSHSSHMERKRPLYEISDNESSSLVKKKRKKIDSDSHSRKSSLKKEIEVKEESCNEDMEDSSSSENEGSSSSRSDEDVSRHSSEHSGTEDESNDNSDNSCAPSNDGSSICSSNNHVNGHSSQTSDTDKETDSSSSTISNQRHSHKKSYSSHQSQKSRSQSDYRQSNKNSGREKYVSDKRKEEYKKKSSHYEELPVKIKQEKIEEPKIKKEKDAKAENKNLDKIPKENNVKSTSVKASKSSSKYEEKNTVKESVGKNIKIEKGADGSIDCESGASFADALLGVSGGLKKSQKKKTVPTSSNKNISSRTTSNLLSKPRLLNSDCDSPNEPLLLKKDIKLEPLEVDLAATLPEITPNYRPLPHYSPPSSPTIKRSKLMSEEEALSSIMSTKNQRTKVFSGNKCSGMSTVPTLFEFCIQVLRENIDALEYTGGVPYDVLKPVLDRATADQLYQLEHYNPYLIEDTDPLWSFHCNKDFRGKKRADLESWRDLYLRCLDEREQKLKALTANISQSIAKSTPVRQTKLAYVDSIVKPPRNIARKQAKFGTANSNKHDIVSKAVIGAHSSTSGQPLARDVVPAPPRSSSASAVSFSQNNILKKKKAPLMAKALQLIKGNRFKR